MTLVEQVRSAKSPRDAILLLAQAIDDLSTASAVDPWEDWGEESPAPVLEVVEDDDATEFILRTPSAEKQERRRLLEKQSLHIGECLNDDSEDWNTAYALGGPFWIYTLNRELVMSLPESTRRALVTDLEEDSPAQAHEMGRDILKSACEVPDMGAGDRALGVGNIG